MNFFTKVYDGNFIYTTLYDSWDMLVSSKLSRLVFMVSHSAECSLYFLQDKL